MCGICGEVTFNGAPADPAALARMMEALARRGPDANGMVVRGRVAFGHQRLKIIDLTEKAQQPMVDSDLGLTIVFNGCIYNYPDLRAELAKLGYTFFPTATPKSSARPGMPGGRTASSASTACSPSRLPSATAAG